MYRFAFACSIATVALIVATSAWADDRAKPPPPAVGVGRGGRIHKPYNGGRNGAPPPPAIGVGRDGQVRGRNNGAPPPPAIGIGRNGVIRDRNSMDPANPRANGIPNPPVVRVPRTPVVEARAQSPTEVSISALIPVGATRAVETTSYPVNEATACPEATAVSDVVPSEAGPAMQIDRLNSRMLVPGQVLAIYGQNFGFEQGAKSVAIVGSQIHPTSVVAWSDSLICVCVPENLSRGRYQVAVYDDDSWQTGSNAKLIAVLPPRANEG
jgi:hypothetical protein